MAALRAAHAQVDYVDKDGIRYQIIKQVVPRQIPVTQVQQQQQTYYRQQVTTETLQHQQAYAVPVTQYQLVSRLHGRWNPFITPYWTHHYEPVTTWQQQVATVQIPVSRITWAPETRMVQTPVTTYQVANEEVERKVPIGRTPAAASGQSMLATGPTATLTAQTSAPATPAPFTPPPTSTPSVRTADTRGYGGTAMPDDLPREGAGAWRGLDDARY
jgi:hypothetical protein